MRGIAVLVLAAALIGCASSSASPRSPSATDQLPASVPASIPPSEAPDSSNAASYEVGLDYEATGTLPLLPEETLGSPVYGEDERTTYLSFNDGTAVLTFSLAPSANGVSLGVGHNLVSGSFDPFYGDPYDFVAIGENCDFEFSRNDATGYTGTFECADPIAVDANGQLSVTFRGAIDADLYQPPWPLEPGPSDFADGMHEVGTDIEPGTYRTREPAADCYWARLSSFSGVNTDIIENHRSAGYAIVTIVGGDFGFESRDCGPWSGDLSAVTDPSGPIETDGTFIVGTDIAPGTWTSTGDPDAEFRCEAVRLTGFSGSELESITTAFAESGSLTVTIEPTDRGFETSDCGTWTRAE